MGDRFTRTLQFYLEDGAGYIQALRDAVERRDYAAAIRPAHSLKSSSRQIGAADFGKLAEQVEHDARTLSQSPGDETAFASEAMKLCAVAAIAEELPASPPQQRRKRPWLTRQLAWMCWWLTTNR